MRHFPIFLDLQDQNVIVIGGGEIAMAKLRVLMKTEARLSVFSDNPDPLINAWSEDGLLTLNNRAAKAADFENVKLVYIAGDDVETGEQAAILGRAAGALVNIVDNLNASDFITPAIVDRSPVTVAIGTEGVAPVLARRIKANNEDALSTQLGTLAQIAKSFRPRVSSLPFGRARREFWNRYYDGIGPRALKDGGEAAVLAALEDLLSDIDENFNANGHVHIIGAGPGDPELLTLKARKALHDADVVIYDRLVTPEILELARREAQFFEVGKIPGGPSWKQEDINALIVEHAQNGAHVARLKGGDAVVFGRLDEEMDALDGANISFDIVPGITSASAAAAAIKTSFTKRGRNSSFRILTGHDVKGFAEHDWKTLAAPGQAAAIYMGIRASRFLQGRLMVHGADFNTPMTIVENASRSNQKIVGTTLSRLTDDLEGAGITGPAILFWGLAPREAFGALDAHPELSAEAV